MLLFIFNGYRKADYIKKHKLFKHMGEHCFWHPSTIPQDAKLISLGDNVFVAAKVSFIAHDMSDSLLNSIKYCGGGTNIIKKRYVLVTM